MGDRSGTFSINLSNLPELNCFVNSLNLVTAAYYFKNKIKNYNKDNLYHHYIIKGVTNH
jgi:hypothetical protein